MVSSFSLEGCCPLPTSRPLCTDSTKRRSTQVNFINLDLMVKEVTLANLVWSTCGGVLEFCINIFLVKLVIAFASDRMASRRFDYLEKLETLETQIFPRTKEKLMTSSSSIPGAVGADAGHDGV